MNHPYKTREGGATVTVFVPYDCKNHCPFCINKGEYADMTGFSLEKIIESIRRMDAITPRCDFVFTGGEPFADIGKLQLMLDEIPTTHRVFINTTLPVSQDQTEDDILAFAERNQHKITCINVSRHMQHYVVESNDSLLAQGAGPTEAAMAGVWLPGRAGDLAAEELTPYAMTPLDAAEHLPAAFAEIVERN